MSKVPCKECNALILPTTAENTGGLCMACKQGIRESMEASRVFYQRQKEYDPFRELWISLVKRCSADVSLSSWSMPEKCYFSVSLLEGELYNGGFDQYFYNSASNYFLFAVEGLKELGASASLGLLQDAAHAVFGGSGPPLDQEERWKFLGSNPKSQLEASIQKEQLLTLDGLDRQFWDDVDGLGARLTTYAREKKLVTPFLVEPRLSTTR